MARPKRERDPGLTRVQMDMPPEGYARLIRVKNTTDSASYAESVRRALWVYETLLTLTKDGGKILIEHDGHVRELIIEGC